MKKKHKVHMLPTEEYALGRILKSNNTGRLRVCLSKIMPEEYKEVWTPQHLYITSDEEIKDGDWYIHPNGTSISQHGNDKNTGESERNASRKIIATTDPKLNDKYFPSKHNIAKIPQSFIKSFCQKGGIWDVEVEYERLSIWDSSDEEHGVQGHLVCRNCGDWTEDVTGNSGCKCGYKPKLIDNTIVISEVEEKMYHLSDVVKAYNGGFTDGSRHDRPQFYEGDVEEWIKENL